MYPLKPVLCDVKHRSSDFFLYLPQNDERLDSYILAPLESCSSVVQECIYTFVINRGSYMSAHVLLNLLNELGKRDKMRGLPSILSLFRNEFNKFNKTRARMLDSIFIIWH